MSNTMTITDNITAVSAEAGQDVQAPAADPGPGRKLREPAPVRNLYVTSTSYVGFTLTDGALRLVVLLYADSLGFDAIQIAIMFSLYEAAGVVTNLFGGVAGSKYGLFCTLLSSLLLQMLCLATIYVTVFECFSGVAKDLMKISGKSTPKLVTKEGAEGRLFRLVAWITGMKNATKGAGSLLGAALVGSIGFVNSLLVLIVILVPFVPLSIMYMDRRLGQQPVKKINWHSVFHKGRDVNVLSAARFWLFGSRDVWFEIALPLFLANGFGWSDAYVGLFLGAYVVVYGNLQAFSTSLYKKGADGVLGRPQPESVSRWALGCAFIPALTGTALYFTYDAHDPTDNVASIVVLCAGILAFSAVFAVNSAIHSYLIVSFSDQDKVSQDVGFYYMSNAGGRLVGVLLGGIVYQYSVDEYGLSMHVTVACHLQSAGCVGLNTISRH
ncbi:putative membrane transporter [Tribonema minus]|uniref:Putative membrane transporter n=1 Tax=Tribonema minus TaxID=303371 RepID=A0A836CEU1_9STRA|nr:putative membrane transporter [Tribonema minus]